MPSGESQKRDETCDLDPEARAALGNVSPELAWLQVEGMVQVAIQQYPKESEKLAREMDLRLSFSDLTVLLAHLSPMQGINHLHYINPKLNLRTITKTSPLAILKAVLRIVTVSDRFAEPGQSPMPGLTSKG